MPVLAGKSLALWVLLSLVLAGCSSSGSAKGERDWSGEGKQVFTGSGEAGSPGGGGGADSAPEGWGIVLEFFSGPGHVEQARQRRDQIAQMIGRRDVYVRVRAKGSVVVLGSYSGPTDPKAKRDLERMQSYEVAGQRPYGKSYLSPPPPPPPDMGSVPELNLLSAKRMAGSRALYTLQVGVYESSPREKSKRAAEKRAVELRQQGDMAFYYHGPSRSIVTIGIFGESAYDPQTRQVSLEVQSLQRRFPHSLMNGEERGPAGEPTPQPSMLVQIPE